MKKTYTLILSLALIGSALAQQNAEVTDKITVKNPRIDMTGFLDVSSEAAQYRASRLIPIEKFNEMSKEEGTIILDARSAAAYKASHIKGAIHLNFSDFTKEKLEKLIPDKNTRILIYCNNNFVEAKAQEATWSADGKSVEIKSNPLTLDTTRMLFKEAPLALNIPTFINLYGYGYENIYELSSTLELNDPKANLVGEAIEQK